MLENSYPSYDFPCRRRMTLTLSPSGKRRKKGWESVQVSWGKRKPTRGYKKKGLMALPVSPGHNSWIIYHALTGRFLFRGRLAPPLNYERARDLIEILTQGKNYNHIHAAELLSRPHMNTLRTILKVAELDGQSPAYWTSDSDQAISAQPPREFQWEDQDEP